MKRKGGLEGRRRRRFGRARAWKWKEGGTEGEGEREEGCDGERGREAVMLGGKGREMRGEACGMG